MLKIIIVIPKIPSRRYFRFIYFAFADGTNDFTQTLNISSFHDIKPEDCTEDPSKVYCRKWADFAKFQIVKLNDNCDNYEIKTEFNDSLSTVFNIANLYLYGAGEADNQTWPIQANAMKDESFVSKKRNSQAVLEAIWFTSKGSYVYVYPEVPLFVSFNNSALRFTANRKSPYIRGRVTVLKYKVCHYENIKIAYQRAIEDTLEKPTGTPDFRMVKLPIWSTWAKYKADINESRVLEFANSIKQYQFPSSQIEIDDKWETCYGSLTVDTGRFPNMKRLVSRLKSYGFRVTIWVHPFINVDCQEFFTHAQKNNFLVKNQNDKVVTQWWNGIASYIDFTNPAAVDWFLTRLKKLKAETGIDSFKFDAGESSWSPQVPVFHVMSDNHPETILQAYVNAAATLGDFIEVRVGRGTQRYPIFVRMYDRETTWTGRLGMDTMIPEMLHMNVIGYNYVLPDMIGGNGYDQIVTEEMFIRWLQINVFMPAMQFSYPPWDFGEKVCNLNIVPQQCPNYSGTLTKFTPSPTWFSRI